MPVEEAAPTEEAPPKQKRLPMVLGIVAGMAVLQGVGFFVIFKMMGGRPDQLPEKYFARSPINFFQLIQGSLFIVQGSLDPNVTPANLQQIRERLDAFNIPYELLVFEDEGHGIDKPANQEILYARLADFFQRALR